MKVLPKEQLFPLIDLWRIGLLDNSISGWCASTTAPDSAVTNPVLLLLDIAASDPSSLPKPVVLTTLRMLSNAFANATLSRCLLSRDEVGAGSSTRQALTTVLVATLLHHDAGVRTAAASLAFNVSTFVQKPRVEAVRSGRRGEDVPGDDESEGEWEVELVSAIIEALRNENTSEDVGE